MFPFTHVHAFNKGNEEGKQTDPCDKNSHVKCVVKPPLATPLYK